MDQRYKYLVQDARLCARYPLVWLFLMSVVRNKQVMSFMIACCDVIVLLFSFESKRRELEDQQLHLNIGLDRLRQTEEDVEALRKGLAVKETELTIKNKEASDKLQKIVAEQAEAEQQKTVQLRFRCFHLCFLCGYCNTRSCDSSAYLAVLSALVYGLAHCRFHSLC